MHVLICISEAYSPTKGDRKGIFQEQESRILEYYGYRVGIVSAGLIPLSYRGIINEGLHNKNIDGINVVYNFKKLSIPGSIMLKAPKITIQPLFEKALLEYIKLYGIPKVIHAHNSLYAGYSVINNLRKLSLEIPVIVTEHSSRYSRDMFNRKELSITKFTASNCSVYTAVSGFQAVTLKKLGIHNNPITLFNPVELKFELHKPVLSNSELFNIISVGRLDNNKNQEILIFALSRIITKHRNVRLCIVGKGPNKIKLHSLSRSLGLDDFITFVEEMDRDELLMSLNNSSLYVSTSNYETFGVSVLEAIVQGIPCVVTASGGVEDIINDENGIIVVNNSTEDLVNNIIKVIDDYNGYNREAIRNEAILKFGSKRYINGFESIYNEIKI